MRVFALSFSLLLVLVWIGAAIWAAQRTPPLDTSTLHGIGILFVVPALLLSASGKRLHNALGLACLAAMMYLAILFVGQISN